MDLVIAPCRQLCDWQLSPTPPADAPAHPDSAALPDTADHPGRLLACTGCGSQWTASERWTPRQADGSEPAAVRAEVDRVAAVRAEVDQAEVERAQLIRRR